MEPSAARLTLCPARGSGSAGMQPPDHRIVDRASASMDTVVIFFGGATLRSITRPPTHTSHGSDESC